MTVVTFYKSSDGYIVGYRAEGHSGYGEHGQDIVCAAVSVLTQSMCNGLTEVLKLKPDIVLKDGLLDVKLPADLANQELKDAQILLKTLYISLRDIASDKDYAGSVKIILKERR